jgi:hypothetical protein
MNISGYPLIDVESKMTFGFFGTLSVIAQYIDNTASIKLPSMDTRSPSSATLLEERFPLFC